MGIIKTVVRHKSTIFAIASGAATIAALYFMHEETKKAEEEKEELFEHEELKEKVIFYGKHYYKTAIATGASLGFLIATKRLDAKAIAGLTGALGILTTQSEELRGAVKETFGQEGVNKLNGKIATDRRKKEQELAKPKKGNNKKINMDEIDIYVPYIDKMVSTTKSRLMHAENEASYTLHSTWECPFWYWLKLIGVDYNSLSKKQRNAIDNLGWWMNSEVQDWDLSFTNLSCFWIKHNYYYNEDKNRLELYFELEPEINPDAPLVDRSPRFNRTHDENQYRNDKIDEKED